MDWVTTVVFSSSICVSMVTMVQGYVVNSHLSNFSTINNTFGS